MNVAEELRLPMGEIERLCEEYQVDELSVFGSVLRREPGESSDIDLLVVFKPEARIGLEFVRLQRELSQVIGRNVDLVSKESLKPLIRDRVLAEAQVLYAA